MENNPGFEQQTFKDLMKHLMFQLINENVQLIKGKRFEAAVGIVSFPGRPSQKCWQFCHSCELSQIQKQCTSLDCHIPQTFKLGTATSSSHERQDDLIQARDRENANHKHCRK